MSSAVDDLRRAWAARLRAAGFGPVEAPARAVRRFDGMRLRIYGTGAPGPLLLIVPAPIKRAYIWDLMPGRSVVRHAVRSGFSVGLIEWTEPERNGTCRGLDDYAYGLIGLALEALSAEHGGRGVLLAGHSLGGTLAAIFAAVQPRNVRGLILVEAPLHFGPTVGALGSLLSMAPWAPEATRPLRAPVPGSVISGMGVAADPIEFVAARRLDALACARDPEALAAHLRVVHWTLDELAMPARLFSNVAGRLCRDDEFYRGTLAIARRRAAPGQIEMPILAVVNPHGRLVPPRSVLPVLNRMAGPHTIQWHAERAPGAALRHVGALAGRDAHWSLWPSVLCWAKAVWQGEPMRGR